MGKLATCGFCDAEKEMQTPWILPEGWAQVATTVNITGKKRKQHGFECHLFAACVALALKARDKDLWPAQFIPDGRPN